MDHIPHEITAKLLSQIAADPQLPRPNPTEAFWQLPPHKTLSQVQSSTLLQQTDIAIIGSGVTGCSIAKNLLDHPSFDRSTHITVFEARNLCSGATGRNGGALTSFVPAAFTHLIDQFGEDQAVKIGRYAYRTLEKMHSLGNSTPDFKDASEVRRLRDVVGFADQETFEAAKISYKKYDEMIPDASLHHEVLSTEEARSQYNVKNVCGAILFDCGAYWPYRLITRIWAQLLEMYGTSLAVETGTPVTSVTYDASSQSHPYTLSTPRGTVKANKVIYATNGYTGHLLPQMRGKLHPLRGTMSTQVSTPAFGHHGVARAWSISHAGRYHKDTGYFEAGLYYSNQNPKTNDIFIGGETVKIDELFVSDDTTIRPEAKENIETVLPRYFENGWGEGERPEIRKVWSGIMGFTSDGLPLVGNVPGSITGRAGDGEWIAAGFCGYGMPQCWSAGEAVAKMIFGEDVSEWLPEVYRITDERLQKMSAEASLAHLAGAL